MEETTGVFRKYAVQNHGEIAGIISAFNMEMGGSDVERILENTPPDEALSLLMNAIDIVPKDKCSLIPNKVVDFYDSIPDPVFSDAPEFVPFLTDALVETEKSILNEEFTATVKQMRDDGHTYATTAEVLGVSVSRVAQEMQKLIKSGQVKKLSRKEIGKLGAKASAQTKKANGTKPRNPFSATEVATIIEMESAGMQVEDMATKLGRSFGSIQGKLSRLMKAGKLKETNTQTEEVTDETTLEALMRGTQGTAILNTTEISTHHKELLIEILHEVLIK